MAGFNEQGLAVNVAEYYGIPLGALHFFPVRVWSSWEMYSAIVEADRQRSTPRVAPAEDSSPVDALGDPGLRRALLAGTGRRMGRAG